MRKVLIIAYEYPPIMAAQALRWFYLANMLATKPDFEVHVLTVRMPDKWGFSGQIDPHITVHRVFAGPFVGLSAYLSSRSCAEQKRLEQPPKGLAAQINNHTTPNILARVYAIARGFLNHILIPDVRSEWWPFAWRTLKRLHQYHQFDVVISSHEPGVDLLLGRSLKRYSNHIHWIADLADPLLAPYTPRWRRFIDMSIERRVCREADRIIVTNQVVAQVLKQRHGTDIAPFTQITQGFQVISDVTASRHESVIRSALGGRKCFTLLFTGNFYPVFREPTPLLQALASLPDVRLLVAGDVGIFRQQFIALGDQIVLLGVLDHFLCLALQQQVVGLVNIGNQQEDQIPGKLFEYFAAQRPILHVQQNQSDEAAALIRRYRRGDVVTNDAETIKKQLLQWYVQWQQGVLDQRYDLSLEPVKQHSWHQLGNQLCQLIENLK